MTLGLNHKPFTKDKKLKRKIGLKGKRMKKKNVTKGLQLLSMSYITYMVHDPLLLSQKKEKERIKVEKKAKSTN